MKYKVVKAFKGSPDGSRVFDYELGDVVPGEKPWSEDLTKVAMQEKWVTEQRAGVKGSASSRKSAPANFLDK